LEIGKIEGIRRVEAFMLPSNIPMQRICNRLGFTISPDAETEMLKAEILL